MTDFKTIEKQGKRVKDLAKRVKEKSISLEELNEFSTLLAEINEKVAVLKYFYAKNNFNIGDTSLPSAKVDGPLPEASPEPQEIKQTKVVVEKPKKAATEDTQPSFSFSLFGSEEKETTEPEPVETTEKPVVEEPIKVEPVTQQAPIKEVKTEDEEQIASNLQEAIKNRQSSTLNDTFLGEKDDSLGSKLKNTPITNLKSAIGINVKFTFINELFAGSADDFNQSVEAIDMMTSADDARSLLSELSDNNNWDLEASSVMQFVEMVERRFM